jgi:hypothetical protein
MLRAQQRRSLRRSTRRLAPLGQVYKHYFLDFPGSASPTSSFSSYPGMLSSLDDFYLLGETRLSITQTTNGIYNTSLCEQHTPLSPLPANPAGLRAHTEAAGTGARPPCLASKHPHVPIPSLMWACLPSKV